MDKQSFEMSSFLDEWMNRYDLTFSDLSVMSGLSQEEILHLLSHNETIEGFFVSLFDVMDKSRERISCDLERIRVNFHVKEYFLLIQRSREANCSVEELIERKIRSLSE